MFIFWISVYEIGTNLLCPNSYIINYLYSSPPPFVTFSFLFKIFIEFFFFFFFFFFFGGAKKV